MTVLVMPGSVCASYAVSTLIVPLVTLKVPVS